MAVPTTPPEPQAPCTRLAERRARLRPYILDAVLGIPDFYFLTDADGTLLDYRARDEGRLYRAPDDFLGKRVGEVLPADIGARFQTYLDQALAAEDPVVFTYSLPGPEGDRHFEAHLRRIGEGLGCATVVREVTDRERLSQSLADQEALLKTMFEQTTDAIVLVDPENGRFVDFNEVALRQLGYTREELAQRSVADIQAAHAPEIIAANVAAILDGASLGFETRHRRKDGSLFDVDVTFRCTDHGGKRLISAVWRDVTERVQTARELDRYRQHLEEMVTARTRELESAKTAAESASRAKSAFLSNMSHEIRTPMNAILGFSHLIRQDPLTPRQTDQLARLSASAQHLLEIINDILDLAKIEADKLTLTVEDFELARIVDQTAGLLAESVDAKGLELVVDLGQVPEVLRGDGARLGQILLHLLGNAVKFTERGEVSLVAALLERDQEPPWLRLEVRDTGIGMSETQLASVFNAFEQGDGATTRRYGGTGLGLTISKRLTELMGGRIGVASQPGRGSQFWIEIPCPRPAAPVPRTAPPHRPLEGQRALVIEDHATSRDILVRLLAAQGIRASAAASGEAGLAELARADRLGDTYRLILIDWRMPGMDGIETAASIRALPLRRPPEALLIMAYGGQAPPDMALRAGVRLILPKPVTPRVLLDALLSLNGEGGGAKGHADHGRPGSQPHARPCNEILLVEDEPINQEVTRLLLEEQGMRVTLAEQGAQAVEVARGSHFDLIIMDVEMPVMDGLAATRAIRRLPGRAEVPIVALTANALDEDRDGCLAAGMSDYLSKPVQPGQLNACLSRWLAARASAGASPARALAPDALAMNAAGQHAAQANGDSAPNAPDRERVRTLLTQLEELLSANDTVANELFAASESLLTTTLGEDARRMGRQIHDYDYALALETLGRLWSHLDG